MSLEGARPAADHRRDGMSEPTAQTMTVGLCGPADRDDQVRLFLRCFKKPIDRRGLEWRYDENPAGLALSLLTRTPEGRPVAGYACSPRVAVTRDARGEKTATVGETGDVMTDPEFRKLGLFSALDRRCMEEAKRLGWPLAFGLPNRRSAHIFVELGWEEIGSVRVWTHCLRAGAAARRARLGDGRLAALATPLAWLAGRRARARLERDGAGYAAREAQRFPAEVGELSRQIERRFVFMLRREAEYLDWRFARSPSGLHRILLVDDAQGAFAGYAVVQLSREDGVGYLVDVLARNEAALARAVGAGLARLAAGGAAVARATAIEGSWWQHVLAGAGFRPPRSANRLSVILCAHQPDHPLVRAARTCAAWYFTDGDRDDETMG
jgi:GNAT superfamily N-acetyltransferase